MKPEEEVALLKEIIDGLMEDISIQLEIMKRLKALLVSSLKV